MKLTFQEWKDRTQALNDRAARVHRMIQEKAKQRFDAAFGYNTQSFICFLYAHNWQNLPNLTTEQRAACRYVNYLYDQQWEPSRIAAAGSKRLWELTR